MKITVENETYYPTLGVLVAKGETIEVPEGDAFGLSIPAATIAAKKKSETVSAETKDESVVNDGSAS